MNTSTNNQKKTFNKINKKINLSTYLSKIVSIKSIKTESRTPRKGSLIRYCSGPRKGTFYIIAVAFRYPLGVDCCFGKQQYGE